jgi:hypothetical protein
VPPWTVSGRWDLWRYSAVLPVASAEQPVSLGEGLTPLHDAPALARRIGVGRLWIKDEGRNPTASFKARGMTSAVTRARALGAPGLVVPTAGNAGAAVAAYGAAAGLPVRVYAPRTTPPAILMTVAALGADLRLVDGHIGDAGRLARADAAESGWADVSTLREPYRLEGMKTMGYELASSSGGGCRRRSSTPRAAARDGRDLEGDRRDARLEVAAPRRRAPAHGDRAGRGLRAHRAGTCGRGRPRRAVERPGHLRERAPRARAARRPPAAARAP